MLASQERALLSVVAAVAMEIRWKYILFCFVFFSVWPPLVDPHVAGVELEEALVEMRPELSGNRAACKWHPQSPHGEVGLLSVCVRRAPVENLDLCLHLAAVEVCGPALDNVWCLLMST